LELSDAGRERGLFLETKTGEEICSTNKRKEKWTGILLVKRCQERNGLFGVAKIGEGIS
jgi:hypothetical protein